MRSSDVTRILVIGAGLMGASAARSLAERGHEVTIIDRDVPAGPGGSSHGSARIFRSGYHDPFFTRLATRSRAIFDELERRTGTRLITPGDTLDMGERRRPAELAEVFAAEGIEHRLMSAEEARSRWPGIAADSDVLWHQGAGVIDAEGVVLAQIALAEASGARMLRGWEARSIDRDGSEYLIRSAHGQEIRAQQVVVAAGGWLPGLLAGAGLPSSLVDRVPTVEVTQENAFHFPYRDAAACGEVPIGGRTSWPTTIHKNDRIQVYTLPGGRDARHRGQKVAEFHAGARLPDASARTGRVDPDNRRRIVEYVRRHLPGLVPEPYAETTCLFTMLPDEQLLVDRYEGITLASPCSGHGAKFAPLIGEVVADLVEGRDGEARFRPARAHRPARSLHEETTR